MVLYSAIGLLGLANALPAVHRYSVHNVLLGFFHFFFSKKPFAKSELCLGIFRVSKPSVQFLNFDRAVGTCNFESSKETKHLNVTS